MEQDRKLPFAVFIVLLVTMILSWFWTKDLKAHWGNVPPTPDDTKASFITLADDQMAYRFYAIMLQNLGNIGGQFQSLKKYNYKELKDWVFMLDKIDSKSNAVTLLAAYYFGAIKEPEKVENVLK